MTPRMFIVLAAAALVLGPAPTPAAAKPLTATARKVFWGSPADTTPKYRSMNAHYLAGNEPDVGIWYKDLKNLRGGYVGVGSDQAYLFLDWMKASFAWLIDYDIQVVAVQWVHHAFLRDAKTPRAYFRFWEKRGRRAAEALLRRTYARHPLREMILYVYRKGRPDVWWRLYRLRRKLRRHGIPSYLTHLARYKYVQQMIEAGRVRPMLVNLLANRGLVGIGKAARRLRTPIRALYLSNAEHYWKRLPDQYRKNISSLPFDERSIVLRTFGQSREASLYSYHTQPGKNFVGWLKLPSITRVHHIRFRFVKRIRGIRYYRSDLPPQPRRRRR